jgi:hypothetical protein
VIDPVKEAERVAALSQRERFQLDDPNWTPVIRDCLEELCDHADYDDEELEHIAVLLHRAHHAGFIEGESRARDEVNQFFANTLKAVSKTERERTVRCYVTETPGTCPECGAYLTEK